MDGALIVNKPAGMTSHDVVARLRHITRERSIGHLGTLDPAATGVLPLLLGRLTRLAQFFQGREKEYLGEIVLGQATDTYDGAGTPVGPVASDLPSRLQIEDALGQFRGVIEQVPPPFSAKKVNGVPAYKLARRGQAPELKPVQVEVRAMELLDLEGGQLRVRVVCATGTYVRSLAHDLGQALGVGAHLGRLQRTRVGEFLLEESHSLEDIAALAATGRLETARLEARLLLPEFPAVVAPAEALARILQGRAANLPEFSRAERVKIFTVTGDHLRLIALGRRLAGTLFHPEMVFPE